MANDIEGKTECELQQVAAKYNQQKAAANQDAPPPVGCQDENVTQVRLDNHFNKGDEVKVPFPMKSPHFAAKAAAVRK